MTENSLTEEQREILERMHRRIDEISEKYKEYFDALAEYDRTGVLKVREKIIYVRENSG